MIDYDVVILGGSLTGRYAAILATHQFKAKVALVEPPQQKIFPHLLTPYALTYLGKLRQQCSDIATVAVNRSSVPWAEVMQEAKGVVTNIEELYSPVVLAALGVDVVSGNGQFERTPSLTFSVNRRQLRSRSYLLATGSRPVIPNIEGLQATGYYTLPEVLSVLTSPNPPTRWVIVGGDPSGIQMAQIFTRFGLDVTLIVRHSRILPQEDPEITQLIQAALEAEGVRILTATPVSQIKQIQGKKWVQAGNQAIETDEVLLCAGQQPDLAHLNLETVGVRLGEAQRQRRSHRNRLVLNAKLQTTHPRIYACGEAIGGYPLTNIANYEAAIALKNALYFPRNRVDYSSIPWAVFSEPQLARVGLTETQARRSYGDVVVLRQYFKSVAAAQMEMATTGVCQVVVLPNGEILGATIVGSYAAELIHVFSLAIAQRMKIDKIAQLAPVYPSFSEIFAQIAISAYQTQLIRPSILDQFLALWCR
ncbi:dihydrolipoyl dehydrogenase family protein [Gloeocapsopsis dulcis]|uniref:Mercuric reductase n=1 Tax=Gloeocapsopsis dulcis AAB1 = 1H9 TaxID=1433147 RepID=A0A6N8FTH2_9CHRO|nr:NAD(P)/FAD-dependent oxidoreductase [Gloeocapsopsis dulcis]MUL35246.1 mercuric reductase [Gloeocapsopsis dulcis AAB1 = 1H9]WNN89128.1 NAD(P)/FAD-dependent oxidoreductase [Gloeocapsopsis dulcis]